MKKYLLFILLIFLVLPVFSFAQEAPKRYSEGGFSLVQCDGVVTKQGEVPCNFANFINMVNFIIRWIFFISITIMAGLFAYAGFLYMYPSDEKRKTANKMLWAAVKGFVIMLVAWFIVSTLLKFLVNPQFQGADTFLLEIKK